MDATTYTTTRVGRNGKPLAGAGQHRYACTTAAIAAGHAARHLMSAQQYATADVERHGNTWTFTPATGSPVRVHVTQDAPIR